MPLPYNFCIDTNNFPRPDVRQQAPWLSGPFWGNKSNKRIFTLFLISWNLLLISYPRLFWSCLGSCWDESYNPSWFTWVPNFAHIWTNLKGTQKKTNKNIQQIHLVYLFWDLPPSWWSHAHHANKHGKNMLSVISTIQYAANPIINHLQHHLHYTWVGFQPSPYKFMVLGESPPSRDGSDPHAS
jgi:hypothetical protein